MKGSMKGGNGMTGNMVSLIGYAVAVAALILMIAGAAAWNNYKSKKNRRGSSEQAG